MMTNLLTRALVAAGLLIGGSVMAQVTWETAPGLTIAGWKSASVIFDGDNDMKFTINPALTNLPDSTAISIKEELIGGTDVYTVSADFLSGFVSGTLNYKAETIGFEEAITGAGFDTDLVGNPFAAGASTKSLTFADNSSIILNSLNGGNESKTFNPQTNITVNEVLAVTQGQMTHADNSFSISVVPEPETYAMMLSGLGMLSFLARRRRKTAISQA